MNNLANISNISCSEPHYMSSLDEFLHCYALFTSMYPTRAALELLLIVFAIFFNALVIIMIYYNSISWTVFDQVLIGHCLIQEITAVVDIPFFHIQDMFGYWPLPKVTTYLWASYDNNVNTTCNLTMAYMCWARLRSIVAPVNFKSELLLRYPRLTLALIWMIGLTIWIPITVVYNNAEYTASLAYDPTYLVTVFNSIFWFLPIALVFVFSVYIIILLNQRTLRQLSMQIFRNKIEPRERSLARVSLSPSISLQPANTRSKRVWFSPQARFLMIILIYWVQWLIPCVITLMHGICDCVELSVSRPAYWLT
jgi:hypothetical protein